ncbi:MAG TPA: ABC transporter substrate-binding protein [Gemmataceae bacterium]|nr:ABC transporter substrate-binding protein [Gemmataceae bacterium]
MTRHRIISGTITLLVWATLVSVGVLPARAAVDDEIRLGMSAAFSGPSKGLGIELYRGSMAYFHEINNKGGIHGRKIVIKAYDDGYNPIPAIDNTIRLIEKDDVFLLFNYVGTPTVTRCLPLLKRHRDQAAMLFFPFTGAEPQRNPPYGELVFNMRASYYQETTGLVDHFVTIGRKRIAVFYQIDAYGRNGWEGVRAALDKHQLKMTGEATYRRGAPFDSSFKDQVNILRKTEPDAIVSVGSYAACAGFIRDARDAGWNVPIANVSFVGSESMLALLQQVGKVKGVDYTQNLVNSQVVPSYHDQTLPAVGEYLDMTKRHKPLPPAELLKEAYLPQPHSFVSLEGFLNAKLLTGILEKMGPPFDRQRLRQAAESMNDFDIGIGVNVSFGPNRHQGIDRVYYTVVQGGRFEPLQDWERWRK